MRPSSLIRLVIAVITDIGIWYTWCTHAIDAEAHKSDIAPRFDMDVRSALLESVLPQPVDDRDDVLVVGIELLLGLAQLHQLFERGLPGFFLVLGL